MSAAFSAPVVKGWCPGLFAPMQAADGWLVRVRPPLGRITAAQAYLLANVAEQDGNGQISLTNRGNVQLRGFAPEAARAFAQRMVAAGLGQADPDAERRLALQVSPLAGMDPACAGETMLCAEALRARLIGSPALSALPDKFGFCVDGGGFFPVGSLQADIMLQAVQNPASERGDWRVVCGEARSEPQGLSEAVQTALALAGAFIKCRETMRPLRVPAVGQRLFAEIGVAWAHPARTEMQHGRALVQRAGHLTGHLYAVAAPLGRLTAATLRACADGAQTSDGILRMTPWGSLIFGGLKKMPEISGVVMHPNDPRLRVYACIGASGCGQASADTGRLALQLAPLLPEGVEMHVSGCAKGCAHPGRATVTLVAGAEGYGVIRNGRAGDQPLCVVPECDGVKVVRQVLSEGDVKNAGL
ncbi:precorrin-3B synthase [Acetobacter persici]|uniref:Precorrin-3B synthase n=1 Tax=Acetobacter persici TaxID=1076596 RepID=A0A6V8I792_9PROT|nr:precorrin-3B synthase [Acetobacter persici]GFE92927.1 precorrin-3B synthase [Acetobacter persici]